MAKVSDLVAQFLAGRGIRHAFAIAGGASLHLIHSVADTPGIDYVCLAHEQAIAMAADGYARATGQPGAAIATSGPGGTNMITGIAGAYYDSIPVLYLTGQVSTHRQKGASGVRQMGFQETDIVSLCRPITKYAVTVNDSRQILYELEKGWHLATGGRPGPVLIDIPDDVQRMNVDASRLPHFSPPSDASTDNEGDLDAAVETTIDWLASARRPVLIPGWGVRLAGAASDLRETVESLGIPFAPTWAALDMLPADHPCFAGTFGTHGTRYGNFAVQNADLLLAVGTRLDTHLTGSPFESFAPRAKKIVVDVDAAELNKFSGRGGRIDLAVQADAREFLRCLNTRSARAARPGRSGWLAQIDRWKSAFPICPAECRAERDVNPYTFVQEFARACAEDEVVMVDTGCVLAWTMQAFECRGKQRLCHDFNNTAMGYALPASIGASLALGRRVVCMIGDGSLQMTIQELSSVVRHQLPVVIVLVDNHGYGMIQQTQDQWLDSRYHASTPEGGLGFPDFRRLAEAYGIPVVSIRRNAEIPAKLADLFAISGPAFCHLEVNAAHRVIPQVKFGRPLEDAEPLLDRRVLRENMLSDPATRAA